MRSNTQIEESEEIDQRFSVSSLLPYSVGVNQRRAACGISYDYELLACKVQGKRLAGSHGSGEVRDIWAIEWQPSCYGSRRCSATTTRNKNFLQRWSLMLLGSLLQSFV